MRVAVLNLTRGGLSGGYRKYLQQVLTLMAGDPRVRALISFSPDGAPRDYPETRFYAPGDALRGFAAVRAQVETLRADVVFIPTAQWIPTRIPLVNMIRNMEPLLVPAEGNAVAEAIRNVVRRNVARRAVARARRVIAVSNHVADFLKTRWQVTPEKIEVVYHGVERISVTSRPPALHPGIEQGFLFTAGSIRPARGLEDLLIAAREASEVQRPIVIGGSPDASTQRHAAELRRLVRRLGLSDRVHWIGTLRPEEMGWCFDHAAAFVMTSRAEACPNTVLEAMAHSCASISTDHPPMPEFFHDAAMYYRARDASDLARNLIRFELQRDAVEPLLRSNATRRAKQFDWRATARATVDQLEIAAGG